MNLNKFLSILLILILAIYGYVVEPWSTTTSANNSQEDSSHKNRQVKKMARTLASEPVLKDLLNLEAKDPADTGRGIDEITNFESQQKAKAAENIIQKFSLLNSQENEPEKLELLIQLNRLCREEDNKFCSDFFAQQALTTHADKTIQLIAFRSFYEVSNVDPEEKMRLLESFKAAHENSDMLNSIQDIESRLNPEEVIREDENIPSNDTFSEPNN